MAITYDIYIQAVLVASATVAMFFIGAWFYGGYLLKQDKKRHNRRG